MNALQRAVDLARAAARDVPAYRAFLAEHDVEPESIRAPADLERLPVTTKDNYHRRYPLAERCRGGRLGQMLAVSSGATGEPLFWPRSSADEEAVTDRFDQVFTGSFHADRRSTLAVVCFALGTWVGGLYTLGCLRRLADRGRRLTVVAPGSDIEEILRTVPRLAGGFEQTVLLGYPPFLKNVIDAGAARGVDWTPYRLKLVTAGEVVSEDWRSLVGERAAMTDVARDTAGLYGTADGGVLGTETPLSIAVRRLLAETPHRARAAFGEARLPTLVQYDPRHRYFETTGDGRLLITGDNGVPLVRYDLGDHGGVLTPQRMRALLDDLAPQAAVPEGPELPFVYLFGRRHTAVSLFGANVYPENIAVGLEQPGVCEHVTGKFVMRVVHDAEHEPRLHLTVELARGRGADDALRAAVADSVLATLRELNSEYRTYAPEARQRPDVDLYPHGHREHFPPGVKHRYTA